ncbi:MAG: methyltransferase domain-containing protein [Acidimicrobiales bacterium]
MNDTPDGHWFETIADHLGTSYLRYSFTKGTANEVAFLVNELGLAAGMRVLDVGCGPGRHAYALAKLGIKVHGVDISQTFVDLATEGAPSGATFERADARSLTFEAEFDAVISLCQGGFGLAGGADSVGPDPDGVVLEAMARALRPGGRIAVSAFSSYFQIRWLEDIDTFDADAGVNHEMAALRAPDGTEVLKDLWTTCFTPRELRLLAARAGLEVTALWSVTPGEYAQRPPEIDRPEFLLVARRPAG